MMRINIRWFVLGIFLLVSSFLATNALADKSGQPMGRAALNISLDSFATGFDEVVAIANAGDGRLFAVERDGRILVVQPNGNVLGAEFLDIQDRVLDNFSERGLLGLAFHPNYGSNGYFYVNYTRDHSSGSLDGDTVIARYEVTGNDNIADPNSEQILMVIDQPDWNHNGGMLAFGPDGYLYIAMGDGGSGGDPWENAQSTDTLLGKLLRIDVDSGPGNNPDCGDNASNYKIPTGSGGNPFADGAGGDCDEIWSLGLRNPWRFSFDRATGDLYIGDVGQNIYEEVDFQPAASSGGENWGWDCKEGDNNYSDPSPGVDCDGVYEDPFFDYAHNPGGHCSVTGGYVYRGSLYPEMVGHYLFADYCSGWFWSAIETGNRAWSVADEGDLGNRITTFGEGNNGELYVASTNQRSPKVSIFHIEEDTLQPTASATPSPTTTSTPTITPTPTNTPTSTPPFEITLVPVVENLTEPTDLQHAGDAELYISQRSGIITQYDPGSRVVTTFLDISTAVEDTGFQQGLLGLAFHPDYTSNGYFYVNYTGIGGGSIVSRFTMTGTLPVATGSEHQILTLDQPFIDNNGGVMAFGPDDYLYIGFGDGGGVGDPDLRAQDPLDLHGKVLRIDVDGGGLPMDCGTGDYTVPADNPFIGSPGTCDEVWALGFRNPWRLSFDSQTGDLYIGDVGSFTAEEIDLLPEGSPGGENFGWSCEEGSFDGPNAGDPACQGGGFKAPLYDYTHTFGRSVTGGYVYRGPDFSVMNGYYFFGDFVFQRLWVLNSCTGKVTTIREQDAGSISSFGLDSTGELYLVDYNGTVYRIETDDSGPVLSCSDMKLPIMFRDN